VITLDQQIDALKELKEIRKDNASYESERKSWKGFGEKPPFPIAFLDDIRDSLLPSGLPPVFRTEASLAGASFKRLDDDLKNRARLSALQRREFAERWEHAEQRTVGSLNLRGCGTTGTKKVWYLLNSSASHMRPRSRESACRSHFSKKS